MIEGTEYMVGSKKNKSRFWKILKISGIIVSILLAIPMVLYPVFMIIMVLAFSGMGGNARQAFDEAKTQLVDSLDNFIRTNNRLPLLLSEIGLEQNAISYEVENVYYVTLLPDNPKDNSYILKFGYRGDDAEYYISKTGEWHDVHTTPTLFVDNDTLRRIDDIKLWLASDSFVHNVDSVRPNTSISFDYDVYCDDLIVFIHRYDKETGIDMKGWAVSDSSFILFTELGDWEYRDEDGKIYHKFWNYRENDSLIYRPDPSPKFIKQTK